MTIARGRILCMGQEGGGGGGELEEMAIMKKGCEGKNDQEVVKGYYFKVVMLYFLINQVL